MYALNEADGEMRWRYKTGARVTTTAAVVDGVVYFGSADGHVYALEAADGKERWRFWASGPILSSPTVDEAWSTSAPGHRM